MNNRERNGHLVRIKPGIQVAPGGYIPCPDHRIPPDAKYELAAYSCELFHKTF